MLLNEVELGWDKSIKGLPMSGVLQPVLLAKTEEQVSGVGLVSSLPVVPVGDSGSLWKCFVNRGVNAVSPFALVVSFLRREAHMSGLRGLFVWKPKAITEAPDTHNA
jgi:hypothetical protein